MLALNDVLSLLTLVIALVGTALSVWALHDAWHDYTLLAPTNGARRLLASGHVRNDAFRLIAQLLLVGLATLTLGLPDLPTDGRMPEPVLTIIAARKVLRLGLSLLLMLGVALDRKDRVALWNTL